MAADVWQNYFDVVILPTADVANYAIALSKQLQRYGATFVLGRRRYIPHVSLYHIAVWPEAFADFSAAVRSVAAKHPGGQLKLRKLEMPVIQTDKPAWLSELHQDLVDSTAEYFDWNSGAEETWSTDYLPDHLRLRAESNLKKYGSPLIGAVFRPHITLTSFEDKRIASGIPAFDIEPLAFRVSTISICQLGPSHSCQWRVKNFRLRSA